MAGGGQDGAQLEQALSHAEIGIWEWLASGDRLACDDTVVRLLGRAGRAAPGTINDLLNIVHAEDRQCLALSFGVCSRFGTPLKTSFRVSAEDGEVRWLEMIGQRVQAAPHEFIVMGTLQDVTRIKQAEAALWTSESRLETVFDQSIVGILHRDRDLNVLMVNDRFLELVGRTKEELTGLPMEAFTHPEDVAWNTPLMIEKERSQESFNVEKRYIRPDGSSVWCQISVSFVPDPELGWSSSIVFAQDITSHKANLEDHKRVRDFLSLALEGAGAGTWETDSKDGRVHLSPIALEMYGLPPDHCGTLSTSEWASFVDPVSMPLLEEKFAEYLKSDEPHAAEFKIRRVDGEERWLRIHGRTIFDSEGRPERTVGLVYDDSERKQAELELKQREGRLRLIQEAARIGTFDTVLDGPTTGSAQFFRNLGFPEGTKSIEKADRANLLYPEDRARVVEGIDDAIRERKDFYEIEYRIIRRDNGQIGWVLARIRPEFDDEGNLVRLVGAHVDITEAKTAALKLRETESLNRGIVESSPDCIKTLNVDGTITFISQKGLDALEIEDANAVIGQQWQKMWPAEAQHKLEAALAEARAGNIGRFDAGGPTVNGKLKWWDVIITPLKDEAGAVTQLLSISRNVTAFREHAEEVRWAAEHDALTGIANRKFFDERLEEVLAVARLEGEQVGLLSLDVDNFKLVNDAFGHDAGDTLLKTLSERLEGLLEQDDFAARLGGDEFAVVIRRLERGRDPLAVADAISARLREPVVHRGCILDCRVSVGVAVFPIHGGDSDQLLKCADTALYAAKSGGRNSILLFNPSFRSELDRRTTMIEMARSALERCEIVPYYQPKVSLRTGRVEGFEALLRWRDAAGEVRLPVEIEAAFEDHELAHEISERMQDRVLEDLRRWLDAGLDIDRIAMNAAAAEFSRNDFAPRLLAKFEALGVSPKHLQIEVTETVFLGRGADHVGSALRALKAMGVEIALDDFGTGYASLSHLKKFPVDVLKIDRSFITDLGTNAGDTAIVCALLRLAADLKIRVVAEGVETPAQAAFLQLRGCDTGQGFLFGRAVGAEQVPALLESRFCQTSGENGDMHRSLFN